MKYFFNLIVLFDVVSNVFGFMNVNTVPSYKSVQLRQLQQLQNVRFINTHSSLVSTKMMNDNDYNKLPERRDLLNTAASILPLVAITGLPNKVFGQDEVPEIVEKVDDGWTQHKGKFDEKDLKDYVTTKSGLLYKDIREGTGNMPNDGDAVSVEMVGYIFETGDKWCNTYKGIPTYGSIIRAGVRENQKFMKGLNEGVKTMKKGGRRILVIPAYLAYSYTTIFSPNNKDEPLIPGGAALVCYVELLDFKKLN